MYIFFSDFECKVNIYDGFAEVMRSKTVEAEAQFLEMECVISLDKESLWTITDSKNFCAKVDVCRSSTTLSYLDLPCTEIAESLCRVQQEISKIDRNIEDLKQDVKLHFNYVQEAGNDNSSDREKSFSNRLNVFYKERNNVNQSINSLLYKKKSLIQEEGLCKDWLNEECTIHSQHKDGNNPEKLKIPKYRIEINIEKVSESNEESFKLYFGYTVKNVHWTPTYVLRADEIVSMVYFADIKQSSGDSWKNAEVRVTKNPKKTSKLEFKNSWLVSSEPEPIPEIRRINGYTSTENIIQEDLVCESYLVSEKITLQSAFNWRKFVLARVEMQPEYLYSTSPKLSTDVHLSALLKNTSGMTLLSGKCKVIQNNVFLINSFIPDVGKGCEFSVPLGVESLVEVEYKLLEIYNQESRMVFSKYERTLSRTILITNKKSQKVKILVTDQVPKSKESSVTVSILGNLEKRQTRKDNHGVAKKIEEKNLPFYHEDYGTIDYLEVLESGETKKIKTTFTVKSEDKCVHGLE